MWFALCILGLSVRTDNLGVTSIVRALGLEGKYYDNLLDSFHSTGVKLDALSATWAKVVLGVFPGLVRVNGRLVLVGDCVVALVKPLTPGSLFSDCFPENQLERVV